MVTIAELDERVSVLEVLVGKPGSSLGDKGSGLSQHIADLILAVASLNGAVAALKDSLDEDMRARAVKREPWARAAWLAVNALVAALAGGGAHWLLTLHH